MVFITIQHIFQQIFIEHQLYARHCQECKHKPQIVTCASERLPVLGKRNSFCLEAIHWQKATIHITYYVPNQQNKLMQSSPFLKERCIYLFQGQHGKIGLINFSFEDDEIVALSVAL